MMEFFEKYKKDLAISERSHTMESALELLLEKKKDIGIIVETGTIRMKHDVGAGQSTLIFGDFCKNNNFHLFTVDNNPDALYIAQSETKEFKDFITYVENDSVEFLKNFNQTIDFLYLDSMDVPEYSSPIAVDVVKSQIHQLLELEAAYDKLAPDAIVLLDDVDFENGGKSRLSGIRLKEYGFIELERQKQSLWAR